MAEGVKVEGAKKEQIEVGSLSDSTEIIYRKMKRKPTSIPRLDMKLSSSSKPKGDK